MIKPFLTIQERCRECSGRGYFSTAIVGSDDFVSSDCHKCKGKGTQTAEIYDLRDFEKCDCNCHTKHNKNRLGKHYNFNKNIDFDCPDCKGTGYVIPKEYEPYEIKKVNEIIFTEGQYESCQEFWFECKEHNLKDNDKLIVCREFRTMRNRG